MTLDHYADYDCELKQVVVNDDAVSFKPGIYKVWQLPGWAFDLGIAVVLQPVKSQTQEELLATEPDEHPYDHDAY